MWKLNSYCSNVENQECSEEVWKLWVLGFSRQFLFAFWASAVLQLCRPWGKISPDNFWSLWNGSLSANSGPSPGSTELKTTFICSVCRHLKPAGLGCFPLVVVTGIDKLESSFKSELGLPGLLLSDEVITLCSQCLEEPRAGSFGFCQSGVK